MERNPLRRNVSELLREIVDSALVASGEAGAYHLNGRKGEELILDIKRILRAKANGNVVAYRRSVRSFLHYARHVDRFWFCGKTRIDILRLAANVPSRPSYRKKDTEKPRSRDGGEEEEVGMEKCQKCKSRNTGLTLLQTRSGDEAMTEFWFCRNCGNRWRH